jgi:hypothetical protein
MATEPVEELWSLWQQEKLPPDKAIGQILQHLLIMVMEYVSLKRRVAKLEAQQKK